jgi:hypothetical protein
VQPRQRAARRDQLESLVDGVVGADQDLGTRGRELAGRREHQVGHALPVIGFEAVHVVGQRRRVHRHLGVRVRAEPLRRPSAQIVR